MKKLSQTIALPLIAMLLVISLPGTTLASTQSERDALIEKLRQIKEEQGNYSQNIINSQNKSNETLFSIGQTRESAIEKRVEIEELEQNIEQAKKDLIASKEKRNLLIRALYINKSTERPYISLLSDDTLLDFFRKHIYLVSTQNKASDQIKKIDQEMKELEEGQKAALIAHEILLSQIDILENQLADLKTAIRENETKIHDLEKNKVEVEQQILAMSVPDTPKNIQSEVVTLNTVDFGVQNSLKIYGSGTPHGIGMSQYGAKAMADSGKSFEEILTHYYQGTYIKQVGTDGVDVRVLLSASPSGGKIIVSGGDAIMISGGAQSALTDGSSVSAQPGLKLIASSPDTRFVVSYKYNRFNSYRGTIEVQGYYGNLSTINILNIEDYLRGVVPGEVSASWSKEALKAQAVAARNYAYKNLKPGQLYDICDTPTCQVYHGASYEFPSTDQAIEETRGKMLYYGDQIITGYYFSSSGGWTENNENVWGGSPLPYLRGVASPGEQSPYNSWEVAPLSKATVEAYLNSDSDTAVGSLQKIQITKRGVSGRVMAVTITGSSGTKIVTGKTFKYVINVNLPDGTQDYIKSALFGIE